MATRDVINKEMWVWEATPEIDPINAVDALAWEFGIDTKDHTNDLPMQTQNWQPVYTHMKRVPTDSELTNNAVTGKIGTYPTNGIPLFMVLGESSSAAGIHTVTDLAEGGSLPTFTHRAESTGGTTDKFFSSVGCKVSAVSGFIDLLSEFKFLSEIIHYNGISSGPSSSLSAIHNGPVHPTDDYTLGGTEETNRYKKDSNMAFVWNSLNITSGLTTFKYDIVMSQEVKYVNNQADAEYVDEGNFMLTFDFGLWRGEADEDSVRTDYDNGTQRGLSFTIYNGPTNYRIMNFTNATIMQMRGPIAKLDDKKLWFCHGFAEDISCPIKDGVSDSYYKD